MYQDAIKKLVIFDYQEGRNKEGPTAMLAGFTGYLQTDGYEVYTGVAEQNGITLIHCMAHARKYFVEALDNDRQRAEHVLKQIQLLYAIEHDCTQIALSFDERKDLRLQQAIPILEELSKWMQQQYAHVLPKSPIGKALAYSIKHWDKLSAYINNGILSIDNNLAENSIRPKAVGRKNYLFCG